MSDILVLSRSDVKKILNSNEEAILGLVKDAYLYHGDNPDILPHSTFLRFPNNNKDRIIGLPATLELNKRRLAGIKWVASFPENINHGQERASASIILNDTDNGKPYCFMEATEVNIVRTASSAALANRLLNNGTDELALVGCGAINFAIMRYIVSTDKNINKIRLFDPDKNRVKAFINKAKDEINLQLKSYDSLKSCLKDVRLISIATNQGTPHILNADIICPGSLVLHISLRDIAPDIIQNSINIVDDFEHVNREKTSINLAYLKYPNKQKIYGTISEIIRKEKKVPHSNSKPIIFSPFGLGLLDIAVADYVYNQALKQNLGTRVKKFS